MRRIQLLTADGHFVAEVEIIAFPVGHEPRVVMWGTRVFVRGPSNSYVEAFAVASLTPSPGLEREPPPEPPLVDRAAIMTLHGTPVDELRQQHAAQPVGQHADYIVMTDEERAKGFVRPVRRSYKHLTCGAVTTMGLKLAETYARDPKFYGATMCCNCNGHHPVGPDGEFVWEGTDEKVGS